MTITRLAATALSVTALSMGLAAPAQAATAEPIVGTTWHLVDSSVSSRDASRATVKVASDLTLQVTSPCNRIIPAGPVRVDGSGGITFPQLGSTQMACNPDAERTEKLLVDALSGATSYWTSDNFLYLFEQDGSVAIFAR